MHLAWQADVRREGKEGGREGECLPFSYAFLPWLPSFACATAVAGHLGDRDPKEDEEEEKEEESK